MKTIIGKFFVALLLFFFCTNIFSINTYRIKISSSNSKKEYPLFEMRNHISPQRKIIRLNSNNMVIDGKDVIPVMGEFHFSRFNENGWQNELLKMKAGGINIVSTYVFWIYHEENEGIYNWSGQRNLRKFLEICRKIDLPVVLRLGPWCHGEVRNGGFPEWLVKKGIKLRENNPPYLDYVQKWYSEIYKQTDGMLWKDGGTVIAIQIENEYRGRGEHLMTLKKMAQKTGFNVPFYTRTGWPKLATPVPYGEIIPLYGDYPDGFWDRSTDEMPGDYWKCYIFRSFRNSTVIATEQLPKQSENEHAAGYPYFTCELGGGMMPSYHRRINISPMDIYSMTLVRLGSGSNLPGYYMYHGGNNPDGEKTTLNERQNSLLTNYNDLPEKSYDFQAPLGEFGQVNMHYHLLRKLHLFLQDFGGELSKMAPSFSDNSQSDFENDSLLRWSVRSNGKSGYIFINNYQRLKKLSEKKNIQFELDLADEKMTLPQKPLHVPSGASFFIPFNMDLNGMNLIYAIAQPMVKIEKNNHTIYVFAQIENIPSSFAFDKKGIKIISSTVKYLKDKERFLFHDVPTGTNAAIALSNQKGDTATIILLDEETSLNVYKAKLAKEERVFISDALVLCHQNELLLETSLSKAKISILPEAISLTRNDKALKPTQDGLFSQYIFDFAPLSLFKIDADYIKNFSIPLRDITMGEKGVAEMPADSDFIGAAEWKIHIPDKLADKDISLQISYTGDVARIYSGDYLLTDNFYNGKPFDVNLKYFGDKIKNNELILKILPQQKNTPIYFSEEVLNQFSNRLILSELLEVKIIEKNQLILNTK